MFLVGFILSSSSFIRITNNLLENLGETKKRFDLHSGTSGIGEAILDFIEWFHSKEFGKK